MFRKSIPRLQNTTDCYLAVSCAHTKYVDQWTVFYLKKNVQTDVTEADVKITQSTFIK